MRVCLWETHERTWWQPVTTSNLVKRMAEHVEKNAGADGVNQWHY
jgi:hypothetical protein